MTTADEESEVQENVVSTLNREILTCVVLIGWAKDQLTGAPNDRFLGNDLKWLVMHPGVL